MRRSSARGLRRFLRLPRSPERIRADVDEELRFDIEMRTRDLIARGTSEADARARAGAEFGDLEGTRHYCEEVDMQAEHDARRANLVSDLMSDVAIAWRGMRKSPGFALVVLSTLALGIGANTAVFSVVRRVLITPLPYAAPEQLYRLYTVVPAGVDADDDKLPAVELDALARQSRSIAAVTEFGNYSSSTYTDDHVAEPWQTAAVAPNFFDVLGVRPALGRTFSEADVVPGAPPSIIIDYELWQNRFGGDQRVVGRRVQLDNRELTIVGVLPADFVGPTFAADALVPLNFGGVLRSPGYSRNPVWRSVARLRAGVTPAAFQAELALLAPRIHAQFPELKTAGVVVPKGLHAAIVGGSGVVLLLVMGAAALVLLVSCVNIAGLFLSRAAARRRELGVRAALGAGRSRLIRQMLAESGLYGLAGGVAGVALAFALKRGFPAATAPMLPRLGEVPLDMGIMAFAAALSIACGLAFGAFPALVATRVDLRDALSDAGGRGTSQGRASLRGGRTLVAAQLALAIVLLVATALLARTFVKLIRTDVGYRTDAHVLTFRVNLPPARYREAATRAAVMRDLVSRIHGMRGVQAVGYTAVSPWNGGWKSLGFRIAGRPADDANVPSIEYATASDEFFGALGIRVVAGRVFGAGDRPESPPVLVVNESAARKFWPHASPIGSRVRLDTGGPDSSTVREVVGVVADAHQNATADAEPTAYVSESQSPFYGGEFGVSVTGDAAALVPAIRQTLHQLDPQLPLIRPRTMRDVLGESVARQRLAMALIGAFAVLALVLSAMGVYSVTAYAVLARTREFGIRAALGAHRASLLALVLREGLATTAIGLGVGLALAAMTSRLLGSLLVGVPAHDTIAFAGASLVLLLVAVAACALPARLATRVDPVDALRAE